MSRVRLKISGESGMGLESSAEILMRALKNSGFYIVSEREFPSLIKAAGINANASINFSDKKIRSVSEGFDVIVALGKTGLVDALETASEGSIILHEFDRWRVGMPDLHEVAASKGLKVLEVPAISIARENGGGPVFANTVMMGSVWSLLGLELDGLHSELFKKFGKKESLWRTNEACLKDGFEFVSKSELEFKMPFEAGSDDTASQMIIEGNSAIGIGAVQAGVRAYYAYPMSPASSILSYLAKVSGETGMLVRQVEDEISAAQMSLGSMHMGARSFTATSGGGFDLMVETVSLSGIVETPLVIVIAQRPGPGTGLPTWTAQGDIDLAIHSGHGEFARLVMAVSDPQSAYEGIQHAMNYAEEFQIPVILLTEKAVAETRVTTPVFENNIVPIKRGLSDAEEVMASESVKAIFFDIDEVLTRNGEIWELLAKEYGVEEIVEDYDYFCEVSVKPDFEYVVYAEEVVKKNKLEWDRGKYDLALEKVNKMDPKDLLFLRSLKSSYRIFIATDRFDCSSLFSANPELENIFDGLYTSGRILQKKRDKEYFEKVLAEEGLRGEEVLFIDDREDNIKVAKEHGINTIHFNRKTMDFQSEMNKVLSDNKAAFYNRSYDPVNFNNKFSEQGKIKTWEIRYETAEQIEQYHDMESGKKSVEVLGLDHHAADYYGKLKTGDVLKLVNRQTDEYMYVEVDKSILHPKLNRVVEKLNFGGAYPTLKTINEESISAAYTKFSPTAELELNNGFVFVELGRQMNKNEVETEQSSHIKNFNAGKLGKRYKLTESGVSPRWLPGSSDYFYFANGDEHKEDGTLDESADSKYMIAKRVRKIATLRNALPDPVVIGPEVAELTVIGFGSTKNAVLDSMDVTDKKVNYLDIQYIWPLKSEVIKGFVSKQKRVVVVEQNATGQLANLIKRECGLDLERWNKYDGRQIKVEEMVRLINS